VTEIFLRPGGPADVPAVLGLLDDAVTWLVAQGRPGQWGTEPLSGIPQRVALTQQQAAAGALHVAVRGGEVVGALVVGDTPGYVSPADGPELYIDLLVTRRGNAIGARLLDHARDLAREAALPKLRVDCYAGDDRGLVAYYERQGFTPTETFEVKLKDGRTWPGQILEKRIT
jgi:GNAT superfamily N-acetyltransferase